MTRSLNLQAVNAALVIMVVMFGIETTVFALCAHPGDPRPPETTVIDGDLILTDTDTTSILLESPEPGGFDRIEVSGEAILSGLLRIRLLDDVDEGDVFEILTAQSVLGEFDEVDARPWFYGQRWDTDVIINTDSVTLRLIPLSFVLGDMNGDDVLDAFDVAPLEMALAHPDTYAATFPSLDQYERGDINGDGRLDAFDLVGYGTGCWIGGAHAAVPEPGVMSVLVLGGLAMLRRRN